MSYLIANDVVSKNIFTASYVRILKIEIRKLHVAVKMFFETLSFKPMIIRTCVVVGKKSHQRGVFRRSGVRTYINVENL